MKKTDSDAVHPDEAKRARSRCPTCGANKRRPAVRRAAMSVDEAAVYLGISRTAAYEAVARGEIHALRVGGRWIIPIDPLRATFGLTAPDEAPF